MGSASGAGQIPPVNRMTHRCKNITLPKTSFAGDNIVLSEIRPKNRGK